MKRAKGSAVPRVVRGFWSLIFLAGLLAACGGGDDAPQSDRNPTVVEVMIIGDGRTLGVMNDIQLIARATYSDGSNRDATFKAAWASSDTSVITVTAVGHATGVGPGKAEVAATLGGVSGRARLEVVVLPAAYFVDGAEYAFEYQLDAQGRVYSYRISQRPGNAYPSAPEFDSNLVSCEGSFSADYSCTRNAGSIYPYRMTGGPRGITSVGQYDYRATYEYSQHGLSRIMEVWSPPPGRDHPAKEWVLAYDGNGGLVEVTMRGISCTLGLCYPYPNSDSLVSTDSAGRLLRAEYREFQLEEPGPFSTELQWSYDAAGLMKQMLHVRLSDGLAKTSTVYTADAEGWLSSRLVRDESVQPPTETRDYYGVGRYGGNVKGESFTQAEPSSFYGPRRQQYVRYEWGRLPTEPTFVPRALTGLNGADYFGIISSHHR